MGQLKETNERYGSDLCRTLKLRLIGGQHQGAKYVHNLIYTGMYGQYAWDKDARRKICRPSAPTIATYNLHLNESSNFSRRLRRDWRMQAGDLYEHWLAETGEWERMIAYVSRCPRIGSKRLALVNLDIDCHKGQDRTQANQTALAVQEALGARIYWEPSTSGTGLHGYALLSWSATTSNGRIRSDMQAMGRLLGELTSDLAVGCSEVRGAPMVFSGREIETCGTWAKVPRPQTREQAEELLSALDHETSAEQVLQSLTDLVRERNPSGSVKTGSYSNTLAYKSVSLSQSSTPSRNRTADRALATVGSASVASDTDTYQRASTFCAGYLRAYYRAHDCLPDLSEVAEAYTAAGLDIGNSDERCLRSAYQILTRSFDPGAAKDGAEQLLTQATEVVTRALVANGIVSDLGVDLDRRRKVYRNRGCKASTIASLQSLRSERLSALLACMRYELGRGSGTWGKAQAQALMQTVFGYKVSDKEFRAAMRWLRRNKLVELVAHQQEKKCRTYRVRSNDDLFQERNNESETGEIKREVGSNQVKDLFGSRDTTQSRVGNAVREASGSTCTENDSDRPELLPVANDSARTGQVPERYDRSVPAHEPGPNPGIRPLTKMQRNHAVKKRVFNNLIALLVDEYCMCKNNPI